MILKIDPVGSSAPPVNTKFTSGIAEVSVSGHSVIAWSQSPDGDDCQLHFFVFKGFYGANPAQRMRRS